MRGVIWMEPRVVVEITYRELMMGRLRDPVLRAVRRESHAATDVALIVAAIIMKQDTARGSSGQRRPNIVPTEHRRR